MIAAAKTKGVFLMEDKWNHRRHASLAVWTRFFPLIRDLQNRLHDPEHPVIGTLHRLFCDFGIPMNISSLPPTSRLKDPALGAGALLDIGIYPITLATVLLGGGQLDATSGAAKSPHASSSLVIKDGIDVACAVSLRYENPDRLAILSASLEVKTPKDFMRIEGSNGSVVVEGVGASYPQKATIRYKDSTGQEQEEILTLDCLGMGFHFEADAVALDIMAGRKENEIMPLAETLRIMRLMDGIRQTNGLAYPQD